MGCYIRYSEGPGRAAAPLSPLIPIAVPNVTAHPSTAGVPITALLYDGPLLCGSNVAIKTLRLLLQSAVTGVSQGKFALGGVIPGDNVSGNYRPIC